MNRANFLPAHSAVPDAILVLSTAILQQSNAPSLLVVCKAI